MMKSAFKKITTLSFCLFLFLSQAQGKESREETLSACAELKQCLTQLFPEITTLGHTIAQILHHPDFLKLYPEITLGADQYMSELISLDQLIQQCQTILATSKFRQDEKTISLLERILSEDYPPPLFNFFNPGTAETYLAAIAQTDVGKKHLKELLKKMKAGEIGGIFWPGDNVQAMGGDPNVMHMLQESMRLEQTPTGAIYHKLDRNIYFPNALPLGEGASLLFHEIIHATDNANPEEETHLQQQALAHETILTEIVSHIKDLEKREDFLRTYYLWTKNTRSLLLPKSLREQALEEPPLPSEEIQNKLLSQLKELSSDAQKENFLKTYESMQTLAQQHTFTQEARAYNGQKIFEQELVEQTALKKDAPFWAHYGSYLKESKHRLMTQRPDLFFIIVTHYHIDIKSLLGLYTPGELDHYADLYSKSKSLDPITRLRARTELQSIPLRTTIKKE